MVRMITAGDCIYINARYELIMYLSNITYLRSFGTRSEPFYWFVVVRLVWGSDRGNWS